ncbi:hypothetical protein HYH03_017601 [Edaphochlamys debaryana]|uniref:Thioesterase domain-containing protein n=1 Tax=Edaphochlamys debaryana TaxID=47281 RepID=A0A835XI60_9CHLO|nr:hypothetical protein HYH03_017601 [Edaphochlamys debaryana]|eukprot:KAG2483547.1 hypothetical protein HYH03_017601 [Edaphochlamys debaryana]
MLASRSSTLSAHQAVARPGAAVSMPRRAHSVASASSSSSSASAASAASALSLTTAAHQLAAAALAASRRHGPASRSATALAAAASSSAAAAAAAAAAASAAAAVAAAASGGGSSGRSAAAAAPVLAPEVRDYELDQFSVVNNAVYSSFFQHGRHEAFAALGHDVDEYARAGTPLALSQLNIAFKAPLRSRDRFRVTVTVSKVSGARLVLHQRVLRRAGKGEEELVAEAEATVVFLDSSYRAARVPKKVTRLFQALVDLRTQAAGGSGR